MARQKVVRDYVITVYGPAGIITEHSVRAYQLNTAIRIAKVRALVADGGTLRYRSTAGYVAIGAARVA